jgi:hypothetical protein
VVQNAIEEHIYTLLLVLVIKNIARGTETKVGKLQLKGGQAQQHVRSSQRSANYPNQRKKERKKERRLSDCDAIAVGQLQRVASFEFDQSTDHIIRQQEGALH